jgi:tetratricopeptide (TPR) repeat protein
VLLSDEGVAVVSRDLLPELQAFFAYFEKEIAGEAPPDILAGAGVTVEQVAAFADAGARFFAAAPWRFLANDDLLYVEAPEVEEGLRYVSVMGAAEQEFGLFFPRSRDQWEALQEGRLKALDDGHGFWGISFDPPWEVPPGDLDLWESRGFAREEGGRLPLASRRRRGTLERPDARTLAFFEGLMSALAATSEAELDTGRWEKEVQTFLGPLRFRLSLPYLFEPAAADEILALWKSGGEESSEETADELADAAWQARGRRRILLARRALEIWPDCADAYVLLGRHAATPQEAHDLFAQGVAAGERSLGPEVLREDAGHFWGLVETRPYMQARLWLAESLRALGRGEEAVAHFEDMLRLNPGDNQGVRYLLANLLLELEWHDRLAELLDRYKDDDLADFSYTRALLAFRLEGDSIEALRLLRQALKSNAFVPHYLLGRKTLPLQAPAMFSPGRDDEAGGYAFEAIDLWRNTPGALEWLKRRTSGPRPAPSRSKKKRRR